MSVDTTSESEGKPLNSPPLENSSVESEEGGVTLHGSTINSALPQPHGAQQRRKVTLDPKIIYNEIPIHIITWNIASRNPSLHDVESLFLPQETCIDNPDIYSSTDILVIGLQEAYQSVQDVVQSSVPVLGKDPLVELFSQFLCQKGFTRLSSSRLLGILTMVFVKCPLLCYIRGIDTCTTKTGMNGWLGNKGASSIRFSLHGVSFCFTNCHLVPHYENNYKRIQELADIFADQLFFSHPHQLMSHDALILFGDLNFRVEGKSVDEVITILSSKKGSELLNHDQLHLEQIRGDESPSQLFNFMEMPISFPPSYKYDPGTDSFNLGRPPAWCDRILWRTHERRLPRITDPEPRGLLTQQHYSIHMQPRLSDHKAVSARLIASVSLSSFVPQVTFNIMTEWIARKVGKISFRMVGGTAVSMWDWIGLYPKDFASSERDFLFWFYTPVTGGKAVETKEYVRTLNPEQVPSEPGQYVLLYKSYLENSVLGMSPVFRINST